MHPRRISTRGIIYHDGKLLCQKAPGLDFWFVPGGGLEKNEHLTDGLHREFIEETGIAPQIGRLLFVQQFKDGEQEQLEFFFHIENPQDYLGEVDLSLTSHGLAEIERLEFLDPHEHVLMPDFLQSIDIKAHLVNSLPVHFHNRL